MHGGILFNKWYILDTHETNLENQERHLLGLEEMDGIKTFK